MFTLKQFSGLAVCDVLHIDRERKQEFGRLEPLSEAFASAKHMYEALYPA